MRSSLSSVGGQSSELTIALIEREQDHVARGPSRRRSSTTNAAGDPSHETRRPIAFVRVGAHRAVMSGGSPAVGATIANNAERHVRRHDILNRRPQECRIGVKLSRARCTSI
jgi:hypothetical protein